MVKSEGKGKSKENNGKSKRKSKGTRGAKGSHKRQHIENWSSQVLKTRHQRHAPKTQESAQTCATDISWIYDGWSLDEWNDHWSFDAWNDDWSSVGWHKGWEQT